MIRLNGDPDLDNVSVNVYDKQITTKILPVLLSYMYHKTGSEEWFEKINVKMYTCI